MMNGFRFRRLAAKTLRKWTRSRAMIVSTLRQRRSWKCLVIHERRYTTLPEPIVLPLLCGNAKGKLSCPAYLTIVLIHNYDEESILEKSLRYVGIENFVLLKPESAQWPSNTVKLIELKKYIDRGDCPTEYVLYIDSADAVLRGDPGKAVQYLHEEECDLLFSSTSGHKLMDMMGKYIPETRRWADHLARDHGCEQLYLNAGVFVGKTTFLKEILNMALEFVTEDDLSPAERDKLHRQGTLAEAFPEFPKGVGSDQMIFTYLHPRFYPRVKIDFKRRLALRKVKEFESAFIA